MRAGQMQRRHQIRKAFGDVLAGARIEPRLDVAALVATGDSLHADAVPFPFRDEVGGIEVCEIRILDRMRQHHRAERCRIAIDWLFAASFQPGEQIEIGRREARPHQLDIMRILVAEGCCGGFGQPRRNPDPHRAGDEFQQRPAPGLIELVEPARQLLWQLGLAEGAQRGDDFGECRRGWVVVAGRECPLRPHQRHRLGEIADIIIGQSEQHGVGAVGDQVADQSGFCVFERQRAGQRRQRVAAVGIGRVAKIRRDQPQLVVAAGLIGEAVKQFGEAVHASASLLACLVLILVAVADEVERPRGKALCLAPMHQRIFLAVGDPDLAGAGGFDGRGQAVPVGVIGNHQRQFDAALPGAGAHPHPARGERRDRIGKPPRPDV